MKKPLLSIIIPAYNEKNTIQILLNKVYNYKIPGVEREIIIIESNSNDGTREVVESFVKGKKGIKLILEEKPQGKGHALRQGFAHATGDIILIQDADLEYDVKDYQKLVNPILQNKTSFVLGSRHLREDKKNNWAIRKFKGIDRLYAYFMNIGGLLFHSFFNILYGVHLTDPTTMYKVFKRDLLKKVRLEGKYFELDWEIVAKFVRLGYVPLEIPIKYESRGPKEGKKVRFFRDVFRWLYTIIKFRFLPVEQF